MEQMKDEELMKKYPTDCFFSPTTRNLSTVIKFSPRLSLQRYITVLQVIRDINERRSISDVTEFGCGSFVFFDNYLSRCDFINHVNQIDINRERLAGALHMIRANECNKLSNTEREPLKIDIFEGNVAKKDSRTQNTDVVVAIEVIEHLFEQDLRLFPVTVFEFINPKVVIVTTPNHDFNILFDNGNKFRDDDHKFEFTKAQFKQWATEIIDRYPEYDVKFFGIGELPSGCSEEIGYCTQMAIFEKKETHTALETSVNVQEYVLIGSFAYFTQIDETTDEEKLWQRIDNLIINYTVDEEDLLCIDNEECQWGYRFLCLPLDLLLKNCQMKDINEDDLIAVIKKFGRMYSIKYFENYGNLLIVTDECEQQCGIHCKEI
ncbi:small RNA 2'-O-methyltransferase-like [Planococcus citri]|uniref:small RNA 2'-O-methyltransferase-like n=1 Tax=Planococcus citri TaxID=170843 RepID=UPI0031F9A481